MTQVLKNVIAWRLTLIFNDVGDSLKHQSHVTGYRIHSWFFCGKLCRPSLIPFS